MFDAACPLFRVLRYVPPLESRGHRPQSSSASRFTAGAFGDVMSQSKRTPSIVPLALRRAAACAVHDHLYPGKRTFVRAHVRLCHNSTRRRRYVDTRYSALSLDFRIAQMT